MNDSIANTNNVYIGIDLGTTTSAMAWLSQDGELLTIPNRFGKELTTSALYFGDDIVVGADALSRGRTDPGMLAEGFKRDVGRPHYRQKLKDLSVPPEVLSGFLLRHLKEDAINALGRVDGAVITVPAYYDEPRRKATQIAGELAGINVLDIVNEPVAAAVAQWFRQRSDASNNKTERILVYDFGGGTFDASLVEVTRGTEFKTLATDGDMMLGGRDVDERLAAHLAEQFLQRHGMDPRAEMQALLNLLQVAEDSKRKLTQVDECLAPCKYGDLRFGVEVQREKFEQLIEPLIERTLNTCHDLVNDAGLGWSDVDEILLVGGSSRIPMVGRRLHEVTGRKVVLAETPEELVAQGAALYAATHAKSVHMKSLTIVNVNAHSLGIEGVDVATQQPINKIVIPRNTPLPASCVKGFVTRRDSQATVSVKLTEGESENPKFCTRIGKCVVHLEKDLPAGTEVKVTCHYNKNGTITVSALVPATRSSSIAEIRREAQAEMEPLDTWSARLLHGQARGDQDVSDDPIVSVETNLDSSQVDSQMQHLDKLAFIVGKSCVDEVVPASILPVQRVCQVARNEIAFARALLSKLEEKQTRSQDQRERLEISQGIAMLGDHIRHSKSFGAHVFGVLGRGCAELGIAPEARQAQQTQIRSILEELKNRNEAGTAGQGGVGHG